MGLQRGKIGETRQSMKSDYNKSSAPVEVLETSVIPEELNFQLTKLALAHEIRNPLTNINLAIAMLRLSPEISNQEIFLDIISRASVKIEELVRSLLAPFQNRIIPSEKHSIHNILDEVLVTTRDRIILKNITVRKEYAKEDCEIVMNAQGMKIALTNLIVNAIEAITRPGGILILRTKTGEDNFVIEIEDNGCGISKKDLKKIFKPYFTNKPGGLGLGLAATLETLRSNHAVINVESVLSKGTCFTITIEKKSKAD